MYSFFDFYKDILSHRSATGFAFPVIVLSYYANVYNVKLIVN
jgi:hypothetical protein